MSSAGPIAPLVDRPPQVLLFLNKHKLSQVHGCEVLLAEGG